MKLNGFHLTLKNMWWKSAIIFLLRSYISGSKQSSMCCARKCISVYVFVLIWHFRHTKHVTSFPAHSSHRFSCFYLCSSVVLAQMVFDLWGNFNSIAVTRQFHKKIQIILKCHQINWMALAEIKNSYQIAGDITWRTQSFEKKETFHSTCNAQQLATYNGAMFGVLLIRFWVGQNIVDFYVVGWFVCCRTILFF